MISRRSFLRTIIASVAGSAVFPLTGCSNGRNTYSQLNDIGDLLPPDENGLMLPAGFNSRIVARSGSAPAADSSYLWHDAPDGGATFSTEDGGWIYVSNSEVNNNLGGVGAIRFSSSGEITSSYSILSNTSRNCAGGATPWGTWLSCEETEYGIVWECDPYNMTVAVPLPALGAFAHEAAAVDTLNNHIYLTEDKYDGGFYRFIPGAFTDTQRPDLTSGSLQIAELEPSTSTINWHPVPDPGASAQATRYQVNSSTAFKGGEGIVFYNGIISFATKHDNRIWQYDTRTEQISVLYDASTHNNPILTGVDNITLTHSGELVVSEDGGDLQLVAIRHTGDLVPVLQITGHDKSEATGPAFSPDGRRLYFSSQRGTSGSSADGITFEVSGPFHS